MRLANFQDDILKPVAAKLEIDYDADLNTDHVRSWIPAINEAFEEGWESLDLPELRATEERAFRTIWNATGQFLRSNATGAVDEFLYLPTSTYYQVKADAPADPPPGTLPTDTTYFEPIVIGYPYIDLDQRGRQAVGEVLGVYTGNPRFQTSGWRGLPFRLSERGIEIRGYGATGISAWLHYRIKPSRFTADRWSSTRTYNKGMLAFQLTDGNVYRSLTTNTGIEPPNAANWAVVPVPAALTTFVTNAAASELNPDAGTAQKFYAKAQAALVRKYDRLGAQGERSRYRLFPARRALAGCWCNSLDWYPSDATELTTLTDIWQDEGGGSVTGPTLGLEPESHVTSLISGQDYIDLEFDDRGNTSWSLEALVENDTDPEVSLRKLWVTTITLRTSSSCRVWLNDAPDTANYKLRWRVA